MINFILGLSAVATGLVTLTRSEFLDYDHWSTVDFDYDPGQRSNDLQSGRLRPQDVVIFDSQLYVDPNNVETLFVTTPNLLGAAPFTLSTVSDKTAADGSPLLVPYPDATWYKGACNKTITSVYKIKLDKLNRLWVLDSGMVNQMMSNSSIICPPKILVFDVKTKSLLKMFEVPNAQHYDDSVLINIEVDIRNSDGSDTMAYVSDLQGFRMLVYNMTSDSSYAIDNPFFNPFPRYCFFRNISGVNFALLKGLFSVTLAPGKNPNRLVYFHSLSSAREGYVSLNIVNDPQLSQNAFLYKVSDERGFHTTVEVMSQNGFLIFSSLEGNSILVWDTKKPYRPEHFKTIAKDDEKFQFITGMQLLDESKLLVTSSRYQNVLVGKIARNETNYRVLVNLDISQYLRRH